MQTPQTLAEAAQDFLAQTKIAVAGVSRSKDEAANLIYRKLRDTGHRCIRWWLNLTGGLPKQI